MLGKKSDRFCEFALDSSRTEGQRSLAIGLTESHRVETHERIPYSASTPRIDQPNFRRISGRNSVIDGVDKATLNQFATAIIGMPEDLGRVTPRVDPII